MKTLSVTELKALIDQDRSPILIDVREAFELELCRLPDALHIPLGQIPDQLGDLDRSTPYIIMCKAGGRSAQAVGYLETQGFKDVTNLSGGINEWSRAIDPSIPLY